MQPRFERLHRLDRRDGMGHYAGARGKVFPVKPDS